MSQAAGDIEEAALDWAMRTGDPAFDDWEAFAAWLEADPAHAGAYHAVSADLAEMTEALTAAPVARPVLQAAPAARPSRRGWIGGALAASLVAALGGGFYAVRPQTYEVATGPGASRTVALADGSSIALNGGTRLILDRRDPRFARVEAGEALFTVRHDAARPFRVEVGEDRLVDLGTVFDVTRDGGTTRVQVAEGAILFNPRGEAVRLDAGRALRTLDGDAQVQLSDVAPEAVGTWRARRLDYDGAPLREVAADVARALGRRVAVAPSLAERPFRGTIEVDPIAADPSRLGVLLGTGMRRTGDGWEIVARP